MLQRLRLASLVTPLRIRTISTSETVKPAFLNPSSRRRPAYSAFRLPTSAWNDRLQAQALAQQQRRQRSPFVQQRYQRFMKQHPELTSGRRAILGRHFAPGVNRPVKLQGLPKLSYLKARLLKQNDPQSTARRNRLLQFQRSLQPRMKLTHLPVPRRHSRHDASPFKQRMGQMRSSLARVASPRRLRVGGVKRFSRRRQI